MTKSKHETTPRQGSPRSTHDKADPKLILNLNNIQGRRLRSVLSVSIKNVRTVLQLKRAIATGHNLTVQELLYRGVRLGDDRQLAHLLPTMTKIGNSPRFSVRTSKPDKSVSLLVKGLQGTTFQVHLPSQCTIADVENAIRDREGYSAEQDFLMLCNGRRLSPVNFSLPVSGSVVLVIGKLPGGYANRGQSFVDMQNVASLRTHIFKAPSNPAAPSWTTVRRGLNIRGKCRNDKCQARDSNVWCQKGFTVFNIAEPVKCPGCMKNFTPETCRFLGCEWMFEGRKSVSGMDLMRKWNVTTNQQFQWFDGAEGQNIADWSSLIITAVSPDGTWQDNEINCALCFGSIDASSARRTTGTTCSHAVHSECTRNYLLAGYDTCPMCRLPFRQG